MGGNKVSPNPWLMDHYPDAYLSMGLTAENVAKKYGITREKADEFSLASHKKALAAIAAGKFKDEIVPVEVQTTVVANAANGRAAKAKTTTNDFRNRRRPARRHQHGSPGQAQARISCARHDDGREQFADERRRRGVDRDERRARQARLGAKPLARFLGFATAGVPAEIMGIGPAYAIPKVLKLTGLKLDQMDVIELNEAFAVQSLAVIHEAGLDPARVNPNGGAIALGHPLGCTGAKLTATILRELERRNARYGMVTMCIGGGMGAAGIFERVAS